MVPAPENPGNTGNSAGSPVSAAVCGVPADAGVLAAAPVAPIHEVPSAVSAASPTSAAPVAPVHEVPPATSAASPTSIAPAAPVHEVPPATSAASPTSTAPVAPVHEVPPATLDFVPEATAAPIPIYGSDVHTAHPDATTAHLERRNRLSQRIPKGFPHPINPKTGRPYRFPRWDWKTMRRKPALRGWIHTVATPLSLAASIVLLVLAPWGLKAACAIYLAASLVLFAMSAVYHQGSWSRRVDGVLRRFDHANIFLLIAGTYTPVSVGLLTPSQATILLSVVWVGAVLGIAVSLIWPGSPRWFSTLLYVILGWAAVMYLPQIFAASLPAFWLLVAGGLAYTVGAVVYALKWPNPSQKYFGFHEIFHSWTVAAWACHCVAAYFSVLS